VLFVKLGNQSLQLRYEILLDEQNK